VITPNTRRIKLRSNKWHAKFIAYTPVIEAFSLGLDGKRDGKTSVILHGKIVFTREP